MLAKNNLGMPIVYCISKRYVNEVHLTMEIGNTTDWSHIHALSFLNKLTTIFPVKNYNWTEVKTGFVKFHRVFSF